MDKNLLQLAKLFVEKLDINHENYLVIKNSVRFYISESDAKRNALNLSDNLSKCYFNIELKENNIELTRHSDGEIKVQYTPIDEKPFLDLTSLIADLTEMAMGDFKVNTHDGKDYLIGSAEKIKEVRVETTQEDYGHLKGKADVLQVLLDRVQINPLNQ